MVVLIVPSGLPESVGRPLMGTGNVSSTGTASSTAAIVPEDVLFLQLLELVQDEDSWNFFDDYSHHGRVQNASLGPR